MKIDSYLSVACITAILLGAVAPAALAQDSWVDSISVDGDIRLRYEGIDEDGEADRDRGRFRMRLGLSAGRQRKRIGHISFRHRRR